MRDIEDLGPSRRALLRGLAAAGGAVLLPGVLVACSSPDDGGGADASSTSPSGSIPSSEIPVGQAKVVDVGGTPVVVAQPTAGAFVALSSACTHQGFTVTAGDGMTITCPNHGSQFDASDGAVLRGPATLPLPKFPVKVDGANLVIG